MNNRFRIFCWTLFDFANTSFSVIIVTVIYSKYFSNYVAGGVRWLWGLSVSISMVLAALLSPAMGAIADISRNRKRFLLSLTLLSIACTSLMFFVQKGDIFLGIILFVLANIGFEAGLVFYDAFLPNLTQQKNFGRVSGYGFAMGYLGALAVLLIVMVLLPDSNSANYYFYVRLSFVVAAVFFLVFSIPIFVFVGEPKRKDVITRDIIRSGISKSGRTFKAVFIQKEFPSLRKFLIAFFLYNDAIITVISFASIFAASALKMTDSEIIYFFVIVQSTAIIGSFVFGIISDHIGPKKTISITLIIWILVVIGAFFAKSISAFYLVGLAAGMSIGSSQSCSRSLMALLTPKEREAEFFGFYDGLFGKSSAVIGPLFYGIISDLAGDRMAALSIGIFFVLGFIILQRVSEPKIKSS